MRTKADVWWLSIAGVLFGVFLLNIFLGKAALLFDTEPIMAVGDVGEFLLLLAAVICFVIEVLRQESHQSKLKIESAKTPKEEV